MERRNVVVTGVAALTSLGLNAETTWKNLIAGKPGISTIETDEFDITDLPCRIAGQVKDFRPEEFIEKKELKKVDRFIQFALATSDELLKDAAINIDSVDTERFGVVIGTGIGGLPAIEKHHNIMLKRGVRKLSPFFIPLVIGNLASGQVSIRHKLKGPNSCIVTACATGTHSIGDAARMIERGDADIIIAGGTEAVITPLALGGFSAAKALSTRNDEPERASRPFDTERDGFIMGEGCGLVLLESEEHAKKRKARIYASVAGYGLSADAYHITSPAPGGEGAVRCMKMCLADRNTAPEEVDYINAHGTSTPAGDAGETEAMKTTFGEHARKLAVSSTKSMIGHLLGAAGGVEAVFSLLALEHGIIPPTINYEHPDPLCDLDYVPNVARRQEIQVAMSNSFGFGGTNASLLFRKYPKA